MLFKKWRAKRARVREERAASEAKVRDEWKALSDAAFDAINEAPTPYEKALLLRTIYREFGVAMSCEKRFIQIFLEVRRVIENQELDNNTMDNDND